MILKSTHYTMLADTKHTQTQKMVDILHNFYLALVWCKLRQSTIMEIINHIWVYGCLQKVMVTKFYISLGYIIIIQSQWHRYLKTFIINVGTNVVRLHFWLPKTWKIVNIIYFCNEYYSLIHVTIAPPDTTALCLHLPGYYISSSTTLAPITGLLRPQLRLH